MRYTSSADKYRKVSTIPTQSRADSCRLPLPSRDLARFQSAKFVRLLTTRAPSSSTAGSWHL